MSIQVTSQMYCCISSIFLMIFSINSSIAIIAQHQNSMLCMYVVYCSCFSDVPNQFPLYLIISLLTSVSISFSFKFMSFTQSTGKPFVYHRKLLLYFLIAQLLSSFSLPQVSLETPLALQPSKFNRRILLEFLSFVYTRETERRQTHDSLWLYVVCRPWYLYSYPYFPCFSF